MLTCTGTWPDLVLPFPKHGDTSCTAKHTVLLPVLPCAVPKECLPAVPRTPQSAMRPTVQPAVHSAQAGESGVANSASTACAHGSAAGTSSTAVAAGKLQVPGSLHKAGSQRPAASAQLQTANKGRSGTRQCRAASTQRK